MVVKLSGFSCGSLFFSLVFGFPGLPFAMGVQALESQARERTIEDLVNIQFQNDLRLFSVMAALNAAGFDHETPGEEMSEVRAELRRRLSGLDPEFARRLKAFYTDHLSQTTGYEQPQVPYTSLALLLSAPPGLSLPHKDDELPADAWLVREFAGLVGEFYQKAGIPQLWAEFEPRYQQELMAYRPVMKNVIRSTLQYFRIPPRIVLDRQIVLIPDLLDVKDIVNARNLERVYYIVVGPSDSPEGNWRQLEHEYLHFLLDPLVNRYGVHLLQYEDLLSTSQQQPHVRSDYQNRFLLVVAESLVEALQLRLQTPGPEDTLNQAIVKLFRRGLIFVPYFLRGLEQYERSDLISLPAYLETLFADFDEKDVAEDEKLIASLEELFRAERQREDEELRKAQEQAERRQQIKGHFDRASGLLEQKKFDQARAEMEQLLAIDADNGNALFYLAQTYSQTGDYSSALGYYQRSFESASSDAWVRAWALLRSGRILASQGRFREAKDCFERVTTLAGDLRGAAEEAGDLLKKLPPDPG